AEKTPGPRRDRLLQRSGLALAGANASLRGETLPDGAGDGLLMTQDAVHLDLAATDLVVLPISGGGVAEGGSGPGLTALQRAFRLAGAKAVLLALWEVPAPLRREVLAEFYRRILAGQHRAGALRAAQQALRAKHPDPRGWGAFVLVGE